MVLALAHKLLIDSPVLLGVILGLGAAAPIGPVNVEIARRTLRGGFVHGWLVGCGAVTVDVCYAVLTGLSLTLTGVLNYPFVRPAMGLGGAAFLAYLAVSCFRGAAAQWRTGGAEITAAPAGVHRHYLSGLVMNLLNPMIIMFWFVVVPAAIGSITTNPRRDLPYVCLGVFLGTCGWCAAFAGAVNLSGALMGAGRRRFLVTADLAGGVTLLLFALAAAWNSVRPAP
jgi:threonine/homoserine/homoserine lactone efflux protein